MSRDNQMHYLRQGIGDMCRVCGVGPGEQCLDEKPINTATDRITYLGAELLRVAQEMKTLCPQHWAVVALSEAAQRQVEQLPDPCPHDNTVLFTPRTRLHSQCLDCGSTWRVRDDEDEVPYLMQRQAD